ncbi:hypothetical protein ZWY2020_053148 [Hordeum vulgare]|nr:hypothetical protein ZWY2020_053148 [Hordeum vulgare]
MCPEVDLSSELALYGHALEDFGYYQMEISEPPTSPSLMALNCVLGGRTAFTGIILAELQHLFRLDWDWVVTPIPDHEFTTIFPDPASLRFGTHSDELTLALNKLMVNISVPDVDPLVVAVLEPAWIQIQGLPPIAKRAKVVRKLSRLLRRIVEVDDASLFHAVVHALVLTLDSAKIQTTFRVFFNCVGYDLRISVEDEELRWDGSPASGDDPPGHQADGDRGDGRGPEHCRSMSPASDYADATSGPDHSLSMRLVWDRHGWPRSTLHSMLRSGRTLLLILRRPLATPVTHCCRHLRALRMLAMPATWV